MDTAKRAILLIAGRGRRLNGHTDTRPKCLIQVGTISILERTLRSLSASGVSETVLVVGYRAEQIQAFTGTQFEHMDITYVHNPKHAETNTAYSLWLAREYLNTDVFLIEGDVLLEPQTLDRMVQHFSQQSVWAGVPLSRADAEGILLEQGADGRVADVELVRRTERQNGQLTHKCAGVQLLSKSAAEAFAARLDAAIGTGHLQIYADLVLSELLVDVPITLCSLDGIRWAEVDDEADYQYAQQLFRENELQAKHEGIGT